MTYTTEYPWSSIGNDPGGMEVIDRRPAVKVDKPNDILTKFIIFNKENGLDRPIEFDPRDDVTSLSLTGYLLKTQTLIFTHGWISRKEFYLNE